MKKNIFIFFLYILTHLLWIQAPRSIIFVAFMPLFLLMILSAAFYSFRKIKRIKWNAPMWAWIVLSNCLLFQSLFHHVSYLVRNSDGTVSHQQSIGEISLQQLGMLLVFLIPFFLLLWGSLKEKVSLWQLKWATVIMLTSYPIACIYRYFGYY